MTDVIGAGAILVKNNKILLVQENKEYNKGLWNLPCGRLDEKENIFKAAIREVKEESDYDIRLEGLVGIYQSINQKGVNVVRFIFHGKIMGGKLKMQANELMDAKWFTFDEIKKMKLDKFSWPGVKDSITDFFQRGVIDYGCIHSFID